MEQTITRQNELEQTLIIAQTEECKKELAQLLNSSKWMFVESNMFIAVKKGYDNVAFSKITVNPTDIKINKHGHFTFPHKGETWQGYIFKSPCPELHRTSERASKAELRIWNATLHRWQLDNSYDDCYGKMHYDNPEHPNAKRKF